MGECMFWIEASRMALSASSDPADVRIIKRIEHPWQELSNAAAIIGLPEEKLSEVVVATFEGTDAAFEQAMSCVGVGQLSREKAQVLLRARTDCGC